MCRDVRPYIRLLTFSVLSISSFITEPTILRLHMMILDMSSHNRSASDFAIRSRDPKNEVHLLHGIYLFPPLSLRRLSKLRIIIQDIGQHNRSASDFWISIHGIQKWRQMRSGISHQ